MRLDICDGEMLAPHTTIGVGGKALHYVSCVTVDDLKAALKWADEQRLRVFILGGGSNVVFPDDGFPGLVVHLAMHGQQYETNGDRCLVTVGAGENWDDFVANTVGRDLGGIECLSGIPGSCGATPIQNVGAYGQEVADTIQSVRALDRVTMEEVEFTNSECVFAYRNSRFKADPVGRYVVCAVTFALNPDGKPLVRYGELSQYVEAHFGVEPTLQQVREAVLAIRRKKSMVYDPADPNSRSCGSFFTNPIITATAHEELLAVARNTGALKDHEKMPAYPCEGEMVKLSAAWLIDHAGLHKGFRHGRVGLSSNHVLAIANLEGGTQHEILELMAIVQRRVEDAFGIRLEPEPVIVR